MSTITKAIGNGLKSQVKLTIDQAIIFSNICPATIFAVSRRDKLIGLEMKTHNSIMTIIGANQRGIFFGKNNEKNPNLCL